MPIGKIFKIKQYYVADGPYGSGEEKLAMLLEDGTDLYFQIDNWKNGINNPVFAEPGHEVEYEINNKKKVKRFGNLTLQRLKEKQLLNVAGAAKAFAQEHGKGSR